MPHADHEPGTREDCEECTALAYEPGWYKALRDERVVGRDRTVVAVPEPDDAEVDVMVNEIPPQAARRRR
ncbi:MAG TPA: hypothetical protein VJ736_04025 [Actinomycetota bacterium]|nr:hypothetical protein [Actinomycetota bacterium]